METLSAFSVPPGFGFHPTDVELLSYYLKRKILGHKIEFEVIPEVDIYKHEPWDLPAKSPILTRDFKWHFFTSRDRKYPNGSRSNRATKAGYWKSTGKDRNVRYQNRVIGTKKTLVFHEGRPPCGKRTDWIMHEYYLNENEFKQASGVKDIFVLCRVTKRDGLTQEDDEIISTQVDKSGNPFIPLSHKNNKNSKQLENVSAPVVQKVEPSHLSGSIVDFEAWVRELYDPNFGSAVFGEPKSDSKVDPSSRPPKLEPMEPCFVPKILDDAHFSLPEGDDLFDTLGDQFNYHAFDYDLFGECSYGTADSIDTNQFNAEGTVDSLSSPVFAAGGCIEKAVPMKNPTVSVGLLDKYGNVNLKDEEESIAEVYRSFSRYPSNTIDSGIQIRERHGGTSDKISSNRIRLQVHKMESRNPGPINQTFTFVSKDSHLDSDDDLNLVSVSSNTKHDPQLLRGPTASNQARTQIEGNFASGKSSSAPVSYQAVKTLGENSSERSEPEVPSSKLASEYSSTASSLHFGRSVVRSGASIYSRLCYDDVKPVQGVLGGTGPFLRRFSSVGLNCLFMVTCMMGTAALISFFLVRDARRFLSSFPADGL